MSKRTCPMKHHCVRESFNRKREMYDSKDYKESRYEVWDLRYQAGPDEESDEVLVYEADDKAECEAYIARTDTRYELRENGVCEVCNMYDKRKADLAEGRVQPFYIVAYGISRYCYSPAEGGCWADWTDIREVRRAFTFQEGVRQARTLKEKYPQPRFNRFSCANRGEDDNYIVLCYGENDPRWPVQSTQRAHYE